MKIKSAISAALIILCMISVIISCSKDDKTPGISIIKISAPGCDPCTNSESAFEGLKSEFGNSVKFINYDVNSPEGQLLVRKHMLKVIPTLLINSDMGIELFRHEGIFTKEQISPVIKKLIKQ